MENIHEIDLSYDLTYCDGCGFFLTAGFIYSEILFILSRTCTLGVKKNLFQHKSALISTKSRYWAVINNEFEKGNYL